ncbi:hypothetical protein L2E82_29852 [Cichorium intybus]|uniref:Uncharacterized protein n=1 Tax=Cichorium intybus TaxID=13427 RepID=A0ACB9CYM8_CICIN|nr:hypothetical protein L2E82_29852 [Cichorium intybus]
MIHWSSLTIGGNTSSICSKNYSPLFSVRSAFSSGRQHPLDSRFVSDSRSEYGLKFVFFFVPFNQTEPFAATALGCGVGAATIGNSDDPTTSLKFCTDIPHRCNNCLRILLLTFWQGGEGYLKTMYTLSTEPHSDSDFRHHCKISDHALYSLLESVKIGKCNICM